MEEVEEHLAGLDEQQERLQTQQNDLNAKDIRFQFGPPPLFCSLCAPPRCAELRHAKQSSNRSFCMASGHRPATQRAMAMQHTQKSAAELHNSLRHAPETWTLHAMQ